ncbi:hypothetical protein [Paraburkholderia caledonica]|uniref:hypothetical protein n=1 Tax=Paraburkholderia caledonica TaxID=134536 RepID=UPI000B493148|nr:hypothetical protein BWU74_32285 [Burkholderia sp. Bk]
MSKFQARLKSTPGKSTPDDYDPSDGLMPSDSFVVSRNLDGDPLSYYGQIAWDRSPYGTNRSGCVLYFDYWRPRYAAPDVPTALQQMTSQRAALVDEIRWLMFVLIYLRPDPLSNASMVKYCTMICRLAEVAEARSITLKQLLADSDALTSHAKCHPANARSLSPLLQLLRQLGPDRAGFKVVPGGTIGKIANIGAEIDNLQTPPLPTRIYTHVLAVLANEIASCERVVDSILQLLTACAKDRLLGRSRATQKGVRQRGDFRPDFGETLRKYHLDGYWSGKGYGAYFQSLSTVLTEIMDACALQIQAFTGMRHNEVQALPHFCLEEVTAGGALHYIVHGRVTKLTGGKAKRAQWVTSDSGRRAFCLRNVSRGRSTNWLATRRGPARRARVRITCSSA